MQPTSTFRPHLITLALLAACSAASAQVTVDADPLKTYSDRGNDVRTFPMASGSADTNFGNNTWSGSLTTLSDLASVTRDSATSTADSTASGTLLGGTFTTASWVSAVSDNRFSRANPGTIRATVNAWVDNSIAFSVGQLSNYSWSATFLSVVSGVTNSPPHSTDPYFLLFDAADPDPLNWIQIFGCQTCANGTLLGSGQLAAGNYVLSWGGSVGSNSETLSAMMGTQVGSAAFTQSGVLNVTAVPEPGAVAMMLTGLAFLGGVAKRRQRKSA
jgi:hypothetical protein